MYFLSEKSEERILAYFVLHPFKGVVRVDTGRGRSEARRLDSVCKTVSLCGVWFVWKSVCETGREKHSKDRFGNRFGIGQMKASTEFVIKHIRRYKVMNFFFDLIVIHGSFFWVSSSILFRFFLFFRCVMNRRNPTVASEPSEFRLN